MRLRGTCADDVIRVVQRQRPAITVFARSATSSSNVMRRRGRCMGTDVRDQLEGRGEFTSTMRHRVGDPIFSFDLMSTDDWLVRLRSRWTLEAEQQELMQDRGFTSGRERPSNRGADVKLWICVASRPDFDAPRRRLWLAHECRRGEQLPRHQLQLIFGLLGPYHPITAGWRLAAIASWRPPRPDQPITCCLWHAMATERLAAMRRVPTQSRRSRSSSGNTWRS